VHTLVIHAQAVHTLVIHAQAVHTLVIHAQAVHTLVIHAQAVHIRVIHAQAVIQTHCNRDMTVWNKSAHIFLFNFTKYFMPILPPPPRATPAGCLGII
jgi:hypothetical protein